MNEIVLGDHPPAEAEVVHDDGARRQAEKD